MTSFMVVAVSCGSRKGVWKSCDSIAGDLVCVDNGSSSLISLCISICALVFSLELLDALCVIILLISDRL